MSSPYRNTRFRPDGSLGILEIRPVPGYSDDKLYTIEPQYHQRPDLLAHDMYKDSKLWWIFAQRNMDTIKDPIYDFEEGVEIYLPKGPQLRKILGL